MNAVAHHPRGRPRKITRDIAVLLAVEWHRHAEGLSTDKAAFAVADLWRSQGRTGFGRAGAPSKSVYRAIRLASEHLGAGRVLVLPGVDAGKLLDAAAFFVPMKSAFGSVRGKRSEVICGPCWRWAFAEEEARLLEGVDERRSRLVRPDSAEKAAIVDTSKSWTSSCITAQLPIVLNFQA